MNPVRVSRKGADRLASGQVWVFASDVLDAGSAAPGDVVEVIDPRGRPLGVAHFSSTSEIRLRLLSRRSEPIDRDFFRRRLAAAGLHRQRFVAASDAYRLVHGEGDLLPGLVIDRYGPYFVLQALDQGMDRAQPDIISVLEELYSPLGILARNDNTVRRHESLALTSEVVSGVVPESITVSMNGLAWQIDPRRGQKTGIFLDQRENYLAAAAFVPRHDGVRALDCFTCTGGFALHLAPHAESVEAVDSSESSLAIARRNAESNGISNIEFREANALDLLASYSNAHRRFSMIVLDPPAFAKSRKAIAGALRGYKEINLRALQLLSPGGVLVTCSCSHHVSEADLLETVASASLDAGRTLRVLARLTQSLDHPILLTVPETHYLKCLIFEVL